MISYNFKDAFLFSRYDELASKYNVEYIAGGYF